MWEVTDVGVNPSFATVSLRSDFICVLSLQWKIMKYFVSLGYDENDVKL